MQNEIHSGPKDNVFIDICNTWAHGIDVLSDNKEIIPEFYFGSGQFLLNLNNI